MTNIFSMNGFSLERLQTLAEVVRAGSIALAAKSDPIAQSLISRQITELEKVLGVALLERTKKPYQPTAVALRLANSCERFTREVDQVAADAAGSKRPITVGAGEVVIREIMIKWIDSHRKGTMANSWVMRNLTWRKIQEGLATEMIDVGIADRLEASANVEVAKIMDYGYKLVLPEDTKPNKSGWKCLVDIPVVLLEGAGRFRRFLAECEREYEVKLTIVGECATYPQMADLAGATGSAMFIPEYWWANRKEWRERTHALPGLEKLQRTMQLGWNKKVAERRPEVAKLVKVLGSGSSASRRKI
jgi:DNA-binding transcriptional LysR family regulator